eukprot:1026798-Pyramimonas_sp.AAC.1
MAPRAGQQDSECGGSGEGQCVDGVASRPAVRVQQVSCTAWHDGAMPNGSLRPSRTTRRMNLSCPTGRR